MIYLLLLALAGLIGAVIGFLVIRASTNPQVKSREPWARAILVGYALSYMAGLVWVSINPLWKTGEVEIWAEFPEHLAWAVLVMAYAQIVCVPLAVAGYALYRRLRPPA